MLKVFIQYIVFLCVIQCIFPNAGEAQVKHDSVQNGSHAVADSVTGESPQNDTAVQKKDTLSKATKGTLKNKVDYKSADTIESYLNEKRIVLKGNAEVLYDDIELTAARIEIDFGQNELYAEGSADSTGNVSGAPVFKEGEDEYECSKIRYNFKTKKGIITDVVTEKEDGYLHSKRTKKHTDKIIDLKSGKYTTCDHKHPHYFISMSKARVIQDDKIVSGPLYLVIEDVPTPFAIPFGFFPFTKEKTSGLIIPGYGEKQKRGFALEELGYYWAINDYMDLKIMTSIYSKGSFQGNLTSKYKKRYRYSGNVKIMLERIVEGEPGLSDYFKTNAYKFIWHHKQDPKARPNSDFSANVNLKSTSANRYSTNMETNLQNTVSSSINYSHNLPGTPFSLNGQVRHTLNTLDSTVNMTLPSLNVNMRRITPFESKKSNKPPNFFNKIGITYKSKFENKFSVKEDELFQEDITEEFKFGVNHDLGISTSAKFLKYFSFSPRANYTERWYFKSLRKKYDNGLFLDNGNYTYGKITTDTLSEFSRVYNYNAGASVNTTVYGLFKFKPFIPVKAIRFVHTPSVGYSYKPNFTLDKYGYYDEIEGAPNNRTYSYYENGIYGVPGGSQSGSINLSLNNQIGMKVRTPKDTAQDTKKIDLLKQFNFNTSYNLAADSLNWSPVSIRAATNLFNKINISLNGTLDPYALDPVNYNRIDKFQYKADGKIGRLTRANLSVSFKLDSKIFEGDEVSEEEQKETAIDYYDYFDIPWSFNISYNYSYNKPKNTVRESQSARVSGNFSITDKWKIGFNTGFDFQNRKMSPTRFNITRDLHCWVMNFSWTPFGRTQGYSFTVGVKSSVLKDLKYKQQENRVNGY